MLELVIASWAFFITAFLFAISMTGTPGPNNIMLLSSSLTYGALRTLPHGLGVIIGTPLVVCMVGLGLDTMFSAFPWLHAVIKVIGITYLLYLAWKIIRADVKTKLSDEHAEHKPMTFLQAILFQWVNPKVWVMAVGGMSALTTVGDHFTAEVILITMAFLCSTITSTSIWVGMGTLISRVLKEDKHRQYFNLVMGIILLATIIPMASSSF